MTVEIRRLSAAHTRGLRRAVLRPHQPESACVYPDDDAAVSGHFGAFQEGELVGVASIYRQAQPAPGSDPSVDAPLVAWRIRGMAVLPERQGGGLGASLLEACLAHAGAAGGRRVWCNARTTAAGFYRRLGFSEEGEEFDLPGIGPHYMMVLDLPQRA